MMQASGPLHDLVASRDETRTWLKNVQAYLLKTLPGGQLTVFLLTVSIEDFRPAKIEKRRVNLHTLATIVRHSKSALESCWLTFLKSGNFHSRCGIPTSHIQLPE
jgi:hypothetical protein